MLPVTPKQTTAIRVALLNDSRLSKQRFYTFIMLLFPWLSVPTKCVRALRWDQFKKKTLKEQVSPLRPNRCTVYVAVTSRAHGAEAESCICPSKACPRFVLSPEFGLGSQTWHTRSSQTFTVLQVSVDNVFLPPACELLRAETVCPSSYTPNVAWPFTGLPNRTEFMCGQVCLCLHFPHQDGWPGRKAHLFD